MIDPLYYNSKEMNRPLVLIKLLHTLIWLFFNVVIVYMYYIVLTGQESPLFWIGLWLIVIECIVLLSLNWTCPLTILARKYTEDRADNFDIYLPLWWARHNKTIYSIAMAILVLLYLWKFGFRII